MITAIDEKYQEPVTDKHKENTMEENRNLEIAFEDYLHDTMEDIQKCLSCDKVECTNCLWMND